MGVILSTGKAPYYMYLRALQAPVYITNPQSAERYVLFIYLFILHQ